MAICIYPFLMLLENMLPKISSYLLKLNYKSYE